MEQAGVVDAQRSVGRTRRLALDGTAYFSSTSIHCEPCSTRRHANGTVTDAHTAVTPVRVKPGRDTVIALAPEFVRPHDGAETQDGELTAAKRWLARHGAPLSHLKTTVLGDDRYGHEPFCRTWRSLGLGFIVVCKPASPLTVYDWVAHLERRGAVGAVAHTSWTGKRHETDTYRVVQAIPLCDADGALEVNWGALTTTDAHGNILYRNALATTLALTAETVVEVVAAGRSRWKIENENHNVLKTKGYHFEHHDGHGQPHLSALLASLIILAFLTHTVLEWMDDSDRRRRQKRPSRQRLFNAIRTLTTYLGFDSWAALTAFMLNSFDQPPPAPETG